MPYLCMLPFITSLTVLTPEIIISPAAIPSKHRRSTPDRSSNNIRHRWRPPGWESCRQSGCRNYGTLARLETLSLLHTHLVRSLWVREPSITARVSFASWQAAGCIAVCRLCRCVAICLPPEGCIAIMQLARLHTANIIRLARLVPNKLVRHPLLAAGVIAASRFTAK